VPAGPDDLAPHYDLTVTLPVADHVAFAAFLRWLTAAAEAHGLTAGVFHEGTVPEAVRRLGDGRLTVGLHLDSFAQWHRPDDPFARLAQAVADAGGCPVNPPARVRRFTDRAAARAELARRGLGLQRGVSSPRLECADCKARPACWRVLHCLGELIPLWWGAQGDGRPSHRLMTREEIRCHRLRSVLRYAAGLARLSGLGWFSSHLCLTDGSQPSRYRVPAPGGRTWAVVALDPISDPFAEDMRNWWPGGLPGAVVRHVAGRFAEAAWLCRHTAGFARQVSRGRR
jgi:hypothetical protein